MNKEIVKILEIILANSYALSLKTQNYHWNVEGPNFKSLHEMFASQYEEISDAVDEIAERIRALGSKVEGSFENFSKLNQNKSGNKNLKANDMLKDLKSDHKNLVNLLNSGVKISQKNGDEATADMFIGRIQAHEKTAWMLDASLS